MGEKLRLTVEKTPIPYKDQGIQVIVSVGATSLIDNSDYIKYR